MVGRSFEEGINSREIQILGGGEWRILKAYLKGVHSQSHGQPINRVHDLIIKNWGFVSNIKTIDYTSYTVHYPINYFYCDLLGRVYLTLGLPKGGHFDPEHGNWKNSHEKKMSSYPVFSVAGTIYFLTIKIKRKISWHKQFFLKKIAKQRGFRSGQNAPPPWLILSLENLKPKTKFHQI